MTKQTEVKEKKPEQVREPTLQEFLDAMWQIVDAIPADGPNRRHIDNGYHKLSAFIKKHDRASAAPKKKEKTARRKPKGKNRNK